MLRLHKGSVVAFRELLEESAVQLVHLKGEQEFAWGGQMRKKGIIREDSKLIRSLLSLRFPRVEKLPDTCGSSSLHVLIPCLAQLVRLS